MSKESSIAALDALEAALRAPQRLVGYRGYSRIIGASKNFLIARQYTTLNARVILLMQDDIAELEAELDELDRKLASGASTRPIHNGSFRLESSMERIKLLSNLKFRLKEYNDYVNSYAQLGSKPLVEARDIRSLKNWLNTFDGAISKPEVEYLNHSSDLIYVKHQPDSTLRRAFGYLAPKIRFSCFRRKSDPEMGYNEPTLMIWNEEQAQAFFTRATIVVGLCMLIGPLWALEFISGPLQRLGLITAFIVLFLFLLSVGTRASPIESLAGTAGYSAVLMVFLQIPSFASTSR